MSGPVELIRERLDAADCRPGRGDRFDARCPAHDDRKPSLSVSEGPDGRALVHCHRGCEVEDVLAALRLDPRDLFPMSDTPVEEAVYTYTDEAGGALFEVVRFHPKAFRQRLPDGAWKLGNTRRALYRLPQLVAAVKAGEHVYIVEGERDVHAAERAGVVATTNPGGAGKWRPEYAEYLRGADVVIVADRDEPGRKHARQVAESLQDVAASVVVVESAHGKDLADHLAAGRGIAELVEPPAPRSAAAAVDTERAAPRVAFVSAEAFAAIDEQGGDALLGTPDDALVAAATDNVMYGDGGTAKTSLGLDLMLHLAAGDPWLGVPVSRPCRVLVVELEGPRAMFRRKLRRKLQGWTGSRLEGRLTVLESPWGSLTLADGDARVALAGEIVRHEIDVLMIGPVVMAGMEGAGTLQEVRDFLRLVGDVREKAGRRLTTLLVHHENKAGTVSGSWEGACDTLLHVEAGRPGRTTMTIQKARWGTSYHGASLDLAWTDGEGFAVAATERDYIAEIEQLLADGRARTVAEIKAPKEPKHGGEPGVGAGADKVREVLIGHPELFAETDGAAAGRSTKATLYRLTSAGRSVGSVSDSPGDPGTTDLLTSPIGRSVGLRSVPASPTNQRNGAGQCPIASTVAEVIA